MHINLQGETLTLLPQKAIYWQAQNAIIVADLHWGKTAHFRKHGIAIPIHTQEKDEVTLAEVVQQYQPKKLIVAGDLFHSKDNNEVANFKHWRDAHQHIEVHLVVGNHDILTVEKYAALGIIVHQELMHISNFIISHHPIDNPEKFYLHGHIHPSFSIAAKGRNKNLVLPCFCVDEKRLILPSFGSFTGTHKVQASRFENIYVVADNEVIQWQ